MSESLLLLIAKPLGAVATRKKMPVAAPAFPSPALLQHPLGYRVSARFSLRSYLLKKLYESFAALRAGQKMLFVVSGDLKTDTRHLA
jgi:hypothetical protein